MEYTRVHRGAPEYTGVLEYTGVHWSTLEYTGVHWDTLGYTVMCSVFFVFSLSISDPFGGPKTIFWVTYWGPKIDRFWGPKRGPFWGEVF